MFWCGGPPLCVACLVFTFIIFLDSQGTKYIQPLSQSSPEEEDGNANPVNWAEEFRRFTATYSVEVRVFEEAERRWIKVDRRRGKGQ
ncbi:hypothetical protein CVT25_006328 [Psilocybe cyanescens]|uniref:Uncharacterized protein n=1 Tax=Psilocybe cyanescens TaxID=93625 RepID=A0A409X3W8_PSICY|nr:hypothetical protein CVT25_006328 [Psilocybe cyanescens]